MFYTLQVKKPNLVVVSTIPRFQSLDHRSSNLIFIYLNSQFGPNIILCHFTQSIDAEVTNLVE